MNPLFGNLYINFFSNLCLQVKTVINICFLIIGSIIIDYGLVWSKVMAKKLKTSLFIV